jgi:hypothetical protein
MSINNFLIVLLSLTSLKLSANSSVKWLPLNQAMITINDYGSEDPIKLYQLLNTPVQETDYGNGKVIQLEPDAFFTLVCDEKGKRCDLVFLKNEDIVVSQKQGLIKFKLKDNKANEFLNLLHLNQDGKIFYQTSDNKLQISGEKNFFEISFKEN